MTETQSSNAEIIEARADEPFFTVVTVTWNNKRGLEDTEASLAGQSCADFEWRVVDGASNDGSREFLETVEAGPLGERLLWSSEADGGIYDAMNKGLRAARGKYVIFMNAGDAFADNRVLEDVKAWIDAADADLDVVYGDAFERDEQGAQLKRALSHKMIWYSMFTHHQSMFYARRALDGVVYNDRLRIAADWAFTASLARRGASFAYYARPICIFERGGVSQSPEPKVQKLLRSERLDIYREVFGMPRLLAGGILGVKEGFERLRQYFPGVYDFIRMRRS